MQWVEYLGFTPALVGFHLEQHELGESHLTVLDYDAKPWICSWCTSQATYQDMLFFA